MDTIELLLQRLRHIKIESTQTPFNPLHLMYREVLRKEELQSKIIGGFLNPNENHNFGDVPLTLFLKKIIGEGKFNYSKTSQFSVDLERTVKPPDFPPRRIDILLSWIGDDNKNHAIIIENKLNWAATQPNQLNDYHDCLYSEGYVVEALVYMPFSSKHQHSKYTDTRNDVLKLTIDFDAQQLVEWLDEIVKTINEEIDISSIIQYKEFLKCLITKKYITMKAFEIIEKLSIEEINKLENLAKLVTSSEWCEARFNRITKGIESHFDNNLEINYKIFYDKDVDRNYNYVEYFFRPYEYWVELFLYENKIRLYIVTDIDKEETITIDKFVFSYKNFDNKHYYYHNNDYFLFEYEDVEKITETVVLILNELHKFEQ